MSMIELIVLSMYGENLSPRAKNDPEDRYRHWEATKLMDFLEKLSIEHNLVSRRENESKTRHSERGGIQFMDGGPIVTNLETLLIVGESITGIIALLKAATPIITQYMKERNSGEIIIKKGKIQIEIHGELDIEKAIDLLKRVEEKEKKA